MALEDPATPSLLSPPPKAATTRNGKTTTSSFHFKERPSCIERVSVQKCFAPASGLSHLLFKLLGPVDNLDESDDLNEFPWTDYLVLLHYLPWSVVVRNAAIVHPVYRIVANRVSGV